MQYRFFGKSMKLTHISFFQHNNLNKNDSVKNTLLIFMRAKTLNKTQKKYKVYFTIDQEIFYKRDFFNISSTTLIRLNINYSQMKDQTNSDSLSREKDLYKQVQLFPSSCAILVYLRNATDLQRLFIYGTLQTQYPDTIFLENSKNQFVNSGSDKTPQSLKNIFLQKKYVQFVVHISDDFKRVVGINDNQGWNAVELAQKLLTVMDTTKQTVKLVFNFALLKININFQKVDEQIYSFITNLSDEFLKQIQGIKKDNSFKLTDLIIQGRTDFLLDALLQGNKLPSPLYEQKGSKFRVYKFYGKLYIDILQKKVNKIVPGRDSGELGRGVYHPRTRPDTQKIIKNLYQHLSQNGKLHIGDLNTRIASQIARIVYEGKVDQLSQNDIINNIKLLIGDEYQKQYDFLKSNMEIYDNEIIKIRQIKAIVNKYWETFVKKYLDGKNTEQTILFSKLFGIIQQDRFKMKFALLYPEKFQNIVNEQQSHFFWPDNLNSIQKCLFNQNDQFMHNKVVKIWQEFYNQSFFLKHKKKIAQEIQIGLDNKLKVISQKQIKGDNFQTQLRIQKNNKRNLQKTKLFLNQKLKKHQLNPNQIKKLIQTIKQIKECDKLIKLKQSEIALNTSQLTVIKQQFIKQNKNNLDNQSIPFNIDQQYKRKLIQKYSVFGTEPISDKNFTDYIKRAKQQQNQFSKQFIQRLEIFKQLSDERQQFLKYNKSPDFQHYYSSSYYLQKIENFANAILESSKTRQLQMKWIQLIRHIKKIKREVTETIEHQSFAKVEASHSYSQSKLLDSLQQLSLQIPRGQSSDYFDQFQEGICFGLTHFYGAFLQSNTSNIKSHQGIFPLEALEKVSTIKKRFQNFQQWDQLQKGRKQVLNYQIAKNKLFLSPTDANIRNQYDIARNQCIKLVKSAQNLEKLQKTLKNEESLLQKLWQYQQIIKIQQYSKKFIQLILQIQKDQPFLRNQSRNYNFPQVIFPIEAHSQFTFLEKMEVDKGYKIHIQFAREKQPEKNFCHAILIFKKSQNQYICFDPNFYQEVLISKQRAKQLILESMNCTAQGTKASICQIYPTSLDGEKIGNKDAVLQQINRINKTFKQLKNKLIQKEMFTELSRQAQGFPCTPYEARYFEQLGDGTKVNSKRKRIIVQMEGDQTCNDAVQNIFKKDPKNTELMLNLQMDPQGNNKSYQYIQSKKAFGFEPVCSINQNQQLQILIIGHGGIQQDGRVSLGTKTAEQLCEKIKNIIKGKKALKLKVKLVGCRSAHEAMAMKVGESLDEFARQLKITDLMNVQLIAYKKNIRIGADGKPFYINEKGFMVKSKMMYQENIKTKIRIRKLDGEVRVTGPTEKDNKKLQQRYKERLQKGQITQKDINQNQSSVRKQMSQESIEQNIAKQYHATQILSGVKSEIDKHLNSLSLEDQAHYKGKLMDLFNISQGENGKYIVNFVDPVTQETKPLEISKSTHATNWKKLVANIKFMNTKGMRILSGMNSIMTVGFLIRGFVDIGQNISKFFQMSIIQKIHYYLSTIQTLHGAASLGIQGIKIFKNISESSRFAKVVNVFKRISIVMPFVNLALNIWNLVQLIQEFGNDKDGKGFIISKMIITLCFICLDIAELAAIYGCACCAVMSAGPVGMVIGMVLGVALLVIDHFQNYDTQTKAIDELNQQCRKTIYRYLQPVIKGKVELQENNESGKTINFAEGIPITQINLINGLYRIGSIKFDDYLNCKDETYWKFWKTATQNDQKLRDHRSGYIPLYYNKNWNISPKLTCNRQEVHLIRLPACSQFILHQRFNHIPEANQQTKKQDVPPPQKETQADINSMNLQYNNLVKFYQVQDKVNRFAPYFSQRRLTSLFIAQNDQSIVTELQKQNGSTFINVILDKKTSTFIIAPEEQESKYLTYRLVGSNFKYGIVINGQVKIILEPFEQNLVFSKDHNIWVLNFNKPFKSLDLEKSRLMATSKKKIIRVFTIGCTQIEFELFDQVLLTLKFDDPTFFFQQITFHFPFWPTIPNMEKYYVIDATLRLLVEQKDKFQNKYFLQLTNKYVLKFQQQLINCNWIYGDKNSKSRMLPCYTYQPKQKNSSMAFVLIVPQNLSNPIITVEQLIYYNRGTQKRVNPPFPNGQIVSEQTGKIYIKNHLKSIGKYSIPCQLWYRFQGQSFLLEKITVEEMYKEGQNSIYENLIGYFWEIFKQPNRLDQIISQEIKKIFEYSEQFQIIIKIFTYASFHLIVTKKDKDWHILHVEKIIMSTQSNDNNPSVRFIQIIDQQSEGKQQKQGAHYFVLNTKNQQQSLSLLPRWFAGRQVNVCICFQQQFDSYILSADSLPQKSKTNLTLMATNNQQKPILQLKNCQAFQVAKFDKSGGYFLVDDNESQLLVKIDSFRNMSIQLQEVAQPQENDRDQEDQEDQEEYRRKYQLPSDNDKRYNKSKDRRQK